MKKFVAVLAAVAAIGISAFAGTAKAYTTLPGGSVSAYCFSYEAGRLAQDANGYWYRCSFTGQGPTGFQWWGIW